MEANVLVKTMLGRTKTTDGVWVSKADHDKAVNYYQKGLISSEDIQNVLKAEKKLKRKQQNYLIALRRHCLAKGKKARDTALQVIEQENKVAIEMYAKVKDCLKPEEWVKVMSIVQDTFQHQDFRITTGVTKESSYQQLYRVVDESYTPAATLSCF